MSNTFPAESAPYRPFTPKTYIRQMPSFQLPPSADLNPGFDVGKIVEEYRLQAEKEKTRIILWALRLFEIHQARILGFSYSRPGCPPLQLTDVQCLATSADAKFHYFSVSGESFLCSTPSQEMLKLQQSNYYPSFGAADYGKEISASMMRSNRFHYFEFRYKLLFPIPTVSLVKLLCLKEERRIRSMRDFPQYGMGGPFP